MADDWIVQSIWLIPALPLTAAVITAVWGPSQLRERSHRPCVVASVLAALLSLVLLFVVVTSGSSGNPADPVQSEAGGSTRSARVSPPYQGGVGGVANEGGGNGERSQAQHATLAGTTVLYPWISVGGFDVPVTLRVDPLAALMLVMVTVVGCLIVVYSVGYMHDDPGYWRFFSYVSLFLFAMTMLVLASNFLLLYVFWEGVGLCSYLLIGFWYQRPAAAAAAKKAFLVNRIGDFGFALGILLLWVTFRGIEPAEGVARLDYDHAFQNVREVPDGAILAICLLLFCGAVGKSAQFPLHVWLPDAMEGPTPVSALIHAATMVTAGVYMVARFAPLFWVAPAAQLVIAVVGGFTALLAALIALTQTDLKRILAYSTISQLGYMFLALGCGTVFAASAAIFHVFTHAFFKALLFLGAGSVMHATGGVMDITRFGGLRRRLPITYWTFACGAASLAGIPLLSGFWSKEAILAATAERWHGPWGWIFAVLLGLGLLTVFLTAVYTFRAFFKTFWGAEELPPEAAADGASESPPVMTWPLIVLAVFSIGIGLVLWPTGAFEGLLDQTPDWSRHVGMNENQGHGFGLMAVSSLMALCGVGVAWWMYGRPSTVADALASRLRPAYQLSRNKFWLDELYQRFVVAPTLVLAQASRVTDHWVVDGIVRLVAGAPGFVGQVLLRPIQNGLVQCYALGMVMGLVVFLVAIWLGGR